MRGGTARKPTTWTTWARVGVVVVTVASAWLTGWGLRLSGDLSTLFPQSGDAAALTRSVKVCETEPAPFCAPIVKV